jgi:hypothetical protein
MHIHERSPLKRKQVLFYASASSESALVLRTLGLLLWLSGVILALENTAIGFFIPTADQ